MEPDYSSSQPRFGYIDVNGGKPRWPHHDKEKVWMVYMVRVSPFWQGPVLEDGRIQCIEIGPCVLDNPTRWYQPEPDLSTHSLAVFSRNCATLSGDDSSPLHAGLSLASTVIQNLLLLRPTRNNPAVISADPRDLSRTTKTWSVLIDVLYQWVFGRRVE